VAHDNTVLRHRCKDRLPWRFQSPRNDDPGNKHFFQRQRDSGAILLAFKLSSHGWQALNISRPFAKLL